MLNLYTMKRFTLLVALVGLFSYGVAQEASLITLSADGAEASYQLSAVQQIVFALQNDVSTMQVINKDGSTVADVRTILFGVWQEVPTSVDATQQAWVFAYPNPVVNTLYIQGVNDDAQLNVFTLGGTRVLQATGTELNVASLTQSTYLLQINNQVIKFIKR